MILRLIRPSDELTPFIRTYWYLKNDSSKEMLQTIVPNGLMPKGYLRLIRHQRIMAYLLKVCGQANDLPSLDDLSWRYGYYGASHLINDFKDIMGYNPSELLKHHSPESYSWVDVEKTSTMIK